MISNQDVLAAIAQNPRTAIVVAPNGRVAELVPQAHLSEAQLTVLLSEIAADPAPDRSPGPVIPTIESKLNPFATARAIAEAITKWIVR